MSMPSHLPDSNGHNIELGLERIVFFSDAVMTIAITMLVIDLKVPEIPAALAATQLPVQLEALVPRLVDEHLEAQVIRFRRWVALFGPLTFLLSIPFAWINPSATITMW
jgi:Endosomal/lysosomal potassium channel TMEM175